ncbi:hypothetical protein JS562_52875, partial [Agrobacterium sp. S2]|nr:hypothetical protein [Agrobacterium sp. S2]
QALGSDWILRRNRTGFPSGSCDCDFVHRPYCRIIFGARFVNGIVAVPIMAAMMIVASRRDEMGKFTIGFATRLFGWIAIVAMAAAAVAMFVFW